MSSPHPTSPTVPAQLRAHLIPLLSVATIGLLSIPAFTLDALRAAGLNGKAPANADAFKSLVDTLTDNASWLIITGLTLAAAILAIFFMVGSQRAPDYLGRMIVGILVLLVGGPALLA